MSDQSDLKEFVKKQAAGMRGGGTGILIVGIILICVLLFLYTYTLGRLHREWEADGIVNYASSRALVALDGVIEGVEPWVLKNAPGLMDQAKGRMVEYAPKLREQVEAYVANLADSLLSQAHDAVSQQVRDLMQTHGQQIREALSAAGDLQKSETAERHLREALEGEFEQAAVNHLDPYRPELLRVLNDMDAKMKLFVETPPEKLVQEDQLEREFIVLVNTIFERAFARLRGT
jgi:hypothetical protein